LAQRALIVVEDEIETLLVALAVAASRRESQARAVRFGRHHDEQADKMRALRLRLMKLRAAKGD
jgi:hypothetical protein